MSFRSALSCIHVLLAVGLVACGSSAAHSSSVASASPSGEVEPPQPGGSGSSAAQHVNVTLSDSGCTPSDFTLSPGTVIFSVSNSGSTKVSEMEVSDQQGHVTGDIEGVAPGETKPFVVDLKVGTYRVRCPQTAPTGGTITVR